MGPSFCKLVDLLMVTPGPAAALLIALASVHLLLTVHQAVQDRLKLIFVSVNACLLPAHADNMDRMNSSVGDRGVHKSLHLFEGLIVGE